MAEKKILVCDRKNCGELAERVKLVIGDRVWQGDLCPDHSDDLARAAKRALGREAGSRLSGIDKLLSTLEEDGS